MSQQQMRLVQKAMDEYGAIFRCDGRDEWRECFTTHEGKLILWFNTNDNSTHVVIGDDRE